MLTIYPRLRQPPFNPVLPVYTTQRRTVGEKYTRFARNRVSQHSRAFWRGAGEKATSGPLSNTVNGRYGITYDIPTRFETI
jgi:hypothetical protein